MTTTGVFHVRATLSIELAATKPSGAAWDMFDGLPDIEHHTTASLCEGCEAFGTSASQPELSDKQSDATRASWDLGVLHLRRAMWLNVAVRDTDISEHDTVGEFELVFDGTGVEAYAANEVAKVSVRFDPIADGAR